MSDDNEQEISYYAYYEPSINRYYYFNNATGETIWSYPTEGTVLNPDSGEVFPNPLTRAISKESKESERVAPKRATRANMVKILPDFPKDGENQLMKRLMLRRAKIEGVPVDSLTNSQQNDRSSGGDISHKKEESQREVGQDDNKSKTKNEVPTKHVDQNKERTDAGVKADRIINDVVKKVEEEPNTEKPNKGMREGEIKRDNNNLAERANIEICSGGIERGENSDITETMEANGSKIRSGDASGDKGKKAIVQGGENGEILNSQIHSIGISEVRSSLRMDDFSKTESFVYNISETGAPPLLIEIDKDIITFDPSEDAKITKIDQTLQVTRMKESDDNENVKTENSCIIDVHLDNPDKGDSTSEAQSDSGEKSSESPNIDSTKIKFIPPSTSGKYLHNETQDEGEKYPMEEFAREHFVIQQRGFFSKQSVSIDQLVSFVTEPIKSPLLNDLPDNLDKLAIKIFKLILKYSNTQGPIVANENIAYEIVSTIHTNNRLVDETYFQLIKQTSGNPNTEALIRTWELFLIIATVFPSSSQCEKWIKSHIARSMQNSNQNVRLLSGFTYIRFLSRCSMGKPIADISTKFIKDIPSHPKTSCAVFGVSLLEIMWGQRRYMPKCPIPYFLVQIVKALVEKGVFEKEGIFRIPGIMKRVKEMANAANLGEEVLNGATINDLASLMKLWFRELTDRVVPASRFVYLNVAKKEDKFIEFAASLPPVNSVTLAYLIGFLQELSQHEDKTMMGIVNLAMVFAPNIVWADFSDADTAKTTAMLSQQFLEYLINKWDVSLVYPMEDEKF